jgi:transketolase
VERDTSSVRVRESRGGAVADLLADAGAAVPLHPHGIRGEYGLIGPPTRLDRRCRLDAASMDHEAKALLE